MTEQAPGAHWRAALKEGRFLLQRARPSGTVFFPPRLAEPGTGETDLEWVEAPGLGTVYTVTVIYPKPPAKPYNVAVIDMEGGGRLMSRVDGIDPEKVEIGMQVTPQIIEEDGGALLVFRPAKEMRDGG